jgi:hypothetical protein
MRISIYYEENRVPHHPRLRIVNTLLEDILVFLDDGPRTSSAIIDLLAKRHHKRHHKGEEGCKSHGSPVYRGIASLLQHQMIERAPCDPAAYAKAEHDMLGAFKAMAQGKSAPAIKAPPAVPYRLTPLGKRAAAFIAARRVVEKNTGQLPQRIWGDFCRSMYLILGANAKQEYDHTCGV